MEYQARCKKCDRGVARECLERGVCPGCRNMEDFSDYFLQQELLETTKKVYDKFAPTDEEFIAALNWLTKEWQGKFKKNNVPPEDRPEAPDDYEIPF